MRLLSILAFGLFVICSGCRAQHKVLSLNDPESTIKFLSDKNFHLKSINGEPVKMSPGSLEKTYITFDDQEKRFSGFAGCNRFFGKYETINDTIWFGMVAATKMACSDLEAEQKFLSAIGEKKLQISPSDNNLIMKGENITLEFVPKPVPKQKKRMEE